MVSSISPDRYFSKLFLRFFNVFFRIIYLICKSDRQEVHEHSLTLMNTHEHSLTLSVAQWVTDNIIKNGGKRYVNRWEQ